MDPETEKQLQDLQQSEFSDPFTVEALATKAQSIKAAEPKEALQIYRAISIHFDQMRLATNGEKLRLFSEASDLGWMLNDPKCHFDRRAAELYRALNNPSMAGFSYKRAADSLILEGRASGSASPADWHAQSVLLREAQICYEAGSCSNAASRCFVERMKLNRDHADNWRAWIGGWFSCIFWAWGESPLRVALWGGAVILFFALLQAWTGFIVTPDTIHHDLPNALYFSIVTFTTLGYGDLLPAAGFGKALACAEALFGIFFTSLFLVTFVKKFSR